MPRYCIAIETTWAPRLASAGGAVGITTSGATNGAASSLEAASTPGLLEGLLRGCGCRLLLGETCLGLAAKLSLTGLLLGYEALHFCLDG